MKNGCVIGMGAIGPVHAAALQARGSLYGICDNQQERLDRFQTEDTALHRFMVFEEVLKDPAIEVVHICTPHFLHADMTRAALAAGKDVVLEKPAAMNAEEFEDLQRYASKSAGRVCVMLQNRTNPSVVKMKELLEYGCDMGKLLGITGFLTWCRDAEYYAQDTWRGKWATEGGGLLINQAIHTLDLLGYLGGKIVSVQGSISNKTLQGVIEVEDTADAIMETEDGLRLCFYATNGCRYSRPMYLEAQLERGVLRYADNRLYQITDENCRVLAYDRPDCPGKVCWGGGHRTVIEDFYRYLETGSGDYLALEDAAPVMETLFAFYQSAKINQKICI
ncbi:Gfo/Idh/MocA family protein [Ructibacterium gallinarum]|uniref:Gfo/Idh/MocA family oxidoreductase n=1 Tax=Ructibacterium gallinarum TaxID=2779355 RepID=A0A9D5LXK9_9FIRM|nr:Gfo/Idh/MocA family oxidoreductase [Ructibacterium gallinarum]MBE5039753.1 Gfo/Idh/MocA family oxidoreductase [Ructibacterium gallinarum]